MDNADLAERLAHGKLVEGPEYASEDYVKGLTRTLIVSGDTELISAPAYLKAAEHAPRLQSYVSVIGIIQDELGHAHIAYRMLRDLGVDTDALIYEREPSDFRYPYAFDVPLESWSEMVVANGFYDRAGFVLLSDIFQHTSYGPWKRALVKVDREETFHLRHGERWMKTLAADAATRGDLQAAVDWMFLMTLEWFGLPDHLKRHTEQIDYGLKGKTNDELRQEWMSTAVPFCESIGIDVPAHLRRGGEEVRGRLSVPGSVRRAGEALASRGGRDHVGRGAGALAPPRPRERGVRRDDPARPARADGAGRLSSMATEAQVRAALVEVLDPEYPVSLVDMGLVREVEVDGSAVRVGIAYCSLGCPCIELIEDDIRERLLDLDGVEHVEVCEVFEPWTRRDISARGLKLLRASGVA